MGFRRMAAAARAANAAFFLAVAAYAFLAASPFAFEQFIKPSVVPALTDFVRLSPILFWLMWLVTLLTLLPLLSAAPRSRVVTVFVVGSALLGAAVSVWRPLAAIEGGRRALAVGVAAIAMPVWLAIVDYRTRPKLRLETSQASRALVACVAAAVFVWATYAVAVPLRLRQVVGVELAPRAIALSLGVALVADVALFTIVFLVVLAAMRLAALCRRAAAVEYWLFVVAFGLGVAAIVYFLVCAALSFSGPRAWIASAALGAGIAAVWADLALVRAADDDGPVEALDAFFAAVAGGGSRLFAAGILVASPFVAYGLAGAVRQLDWDFLLQKLGVVLVCAAALAACHRVVRTRRHDWGVALVAIPVAALASAGVPALSLDAAASSYAAVDPSFRLLRDVRTAHSSDTAAYYRYLRAHTLVSPDRVAAIDTDFVRPLGPSPHRPPNIFLLVVDSLRRDYVSAYNPQVTFTPNIARFAAESDVFERAFTRYAGTYLSVQSLWAGGLPFHTSDVAGGFDRRNTLGKLLEANNYQPIMTRDHVVGELLPESADAIVLERGRKQMEMHACPAVDELEPALAARNPDRPIFFWSLPQDVHISVLTNVTMSPGEAYPGFFDKVAHQVRRLDACVGRLVALLKRANLYDDSIIVLSADHGDLYGLEGRWGHANLIYPDVMRVPLIVHVPPRLRAELQADLGEVAFLTDISPTLYRLLGYNPKEPGPLFGRPLYAAAGAAVRSRRRDDFLVGSSYGAVYGVVRENGERMYVVDTIEGREYLQDMSGPSARSLDVTPAMTAEHRALIRRDIEHLSALYRFTP